MALRITSRIFVFSFVLTTVGSVQAALELGLFPLKSTKHFCLVWQKGSCHAILPASLVLAMFAFPSNFVQKQVSKLGCPSFRKDISKVQINHCKIAYTVGSPLEWFLLVRISNQYDFFKPKNHTIFLISTVFLNISGEHFSN